MNTSKLKEAIEELEAEAARCKEAADQLRAIFVRFNGGYNQVVKPKLVIQPRLKPKLILKSKLNLTPGEDKSVRTLAIEILKHEQKPVHIKELLPMVNEQRKTPTDRAAIESQLTRALKTNKFPGLKRTAPGTFAYS